MKKLFKLMLVSLLMVSCSKDDEAPAAKPLKNIGGNYEADVRFVYWWSGGRIDTSYKTNFEITEQDSDTINVRFLNEDNVYSGAKLYFMPNQTSEDTLKYETPYNYPGYGGAQFYFYKETQKFYYKYEHNFTGASGFRGYSYVIKN